MISIWSNSSFLIADYSFYCQVSLDSHVLQYFSVVVSQYTVLVILPVHNKNTHVHGLPNMFTSVNTCIIRTTSCGSTRFGCTDSWHSEPPFAQIILTAARPTIPSYLKTSLSAGSQCDSCWTTTLLLTASVAKWPRAPLFIMPLTSAPPPPNN